MNGKTVLITGGNAGIGCATAIQLAKKGAEVVIAGRDRAKVETAAGMIRKESGNSQIHPLVLDLGNFVSIARAAEQFQQSHSTLDVLINNAGIFSSQFRLTRDGFESHFGINHLGHFLLTHLLLDPLNAAPDPRVVNVSSVAYLHGEIDFNNLRGEKGPEYYRAMNAYAQSKLANVLFTREFSRRHPRITANALHPGVVRTNLATKNAKWYVKLLWIFWQPFMVSAEKGARTSVYVAESPRLKDVTGQFFDQRKCRRKLPPRVCNGKLSGKLWDRSKELVGLT